MSKRTDCHRPGAIIPSDYRHEVSYITGSANGPPVCVDLALDKMRAALETGHGIFGRCGTCGVCGAHYVYGEMWSHAPTGDLVHLGHDCAEKYDMLSGTDWNAKIDAYRRHNAATIQARVNAERRTGQLAANPGLVEAFDCTHYIVQDIKRKFETSNFAISDKQISLVLKIAREEAARAARPPEAHIPAPTGRQVIRGVLVSKKSHDGPWGSTIKGVIKVQTPGGSWLAWGTLPDALWTNEVNGRDTLGVIYSTRRRGPEMGDEIELTGTLTPGKDAHFAFFKRPTGARIITKKQEKSA
jgi:hypothetical protein